MARGKVGTLEKERRSNANLKRDRRNEIGNALVQITSAATRKSSNFPLAKMDV